MKLSSFELRALKAAQQSLTSPPSPVRFLKRSYAWQIALLVGSAAYYWWGGWHWLSFILQGFARSQIGSASQS